MFEACKSKPELLEILNNQEFVCDKHIKSEKNSRLWKAYSKINVEWYNDATSSGVKSRKKTLDNKSSGVYAPSVSCCFVLAKLQQDYKSKP